MNPKFKRRLAAAVALLCFAMVMMGAKPKVQYQFGTTNNSVDLTNIIISIAGTATNADGSTITNLASGLSATNLTLYGATIASATGITSTNLTLANAFTNSVWNVVTTSNVTELTYDTNKIVIDLATNTTYIQGEYAYLVGTNLSGSYYSIYTNTYFEIWFNTNADENPFSAKYCLFTNGMRAMNHIVAAANAVANSTVSDWSVQNLFPYYPLTSYVPTNTISHSYDSFVRLTGAQLESDKSVQQATNLVDGLRKDVSGFAEYAQLARQLMIQWAETNAFTFRAGPLVGRSAYAPGAAYENILYGDYGYNLSGLYPLVTANDLYAIIQEQAANQMASGNLPNSISIDGMSGTYGLGPLDFLTFANEIYYHWRTTGGTEAYTTFAANIALADGYAKITNGLMWIDEGEVSYYAGDQENIEVGGKFSGYESVGTLGYYDAYKKLAEVSAAAGDITASTNYLRCCSNMVGRLEAVLWDATNNLFLCYNTETNLDSFASAYAVYLGACRPEIARNIVQKFGEDFGTFSIYLQDGALRRSPGSTHHFYAWVPYTVNVLRQYDRNLAELVLARALMLWKESSPEGTSNNYLMGPALTYGFLANPPVMMVGQQSISALTATTAANWSGSNAMQAQIDLAVTNTQDSVSFGSVSLSTTHQETTWTLDDETGDTTMEVGSPDTNIVFTSAGTIKANFSGDGSGRTNLNGANTQASTIASNALGATVIEFIRSARGVNGPITTVVTDTGTAPTTTNLTLTGSQNAVRIWSGEQPLAEPYFDLYVSTNGGSAFAVRMYRWQGRIINAAQGAAVGLATANGRSLQVSAMTVPGTLETPAGVTNYAMLDRAGPPLWAPDSSHVVLPAENGAFRLVADNTDRTIFISEFDGYVWSPPRWITITNYDTTVRATYRRVALASYDGVPMKVVAPAGSQVGGISRRMELGVPSGFRKFNCSTVAQFETAITNVTAGDAIVLADGTYALTINITNDCFVSNGSPCGIIIRSASGNRDAVVISGSATNTGDWSIQGNSATNNAALWFKDVTFDLTNRFGSLLFNGGFIRFNNVRVTGPTLTPFRASVFLTTAYYDIDAQFVDCQIDNGSDDLFSATGTGTNRPNSKIQFVNSSAYRPGNDAAAQCFTTHLGQRVESYGGYFHDANANVWANGDQGAITYGFWPRIDNGLGTNSGVGYGVSVFGGWFGPDDSTTCAPPTNGYWLFTRMARQVQLASSASPGVLVAHNRLTKAPGASGNYAFNMTKSASTTGWTVLGNIAHGLAAAGFFNSGTEGTLTNQTQIINNTFDTCVSGFDLRASYAHLGLTNNATKGGNGVANLAAAYMPYVHPDYNTLDPTIDGDYSAGANDIVNADAGLDGNWFPTAGGNCDTNGVSLGYVGDSDPFGFVLIYGETLVPRGARSRQAILPGARLSPDFW